MIIFVDIFYRCYASSASINTVDNKRVSMMEDYGKCNSLGICWNKDVGCVISKVMRI